MTRITLAVGRAVLLAGAALTVPVDARIAGNRIASNTVALHAAPQGTALDIVAVELPSGITLSR